MTPAHVAQLIDDLIALFDPIVQAVEDIDSAEALLKDMGYQPPTGIAFLDEFSAALGALMTVVDQADTLLRADTEPDYLALFRGLIIAIQDVVKLIRDIGGTLQTNFSADFLAATHIVEQFPRQLADYLLVKMLERQHPVLHNSLLVVGFIDQGEVTTAATPFSIPYTKRMIRWEKLGDYFNSPLASIQQAYDWNTDDFDYAGMIENIHRFGQSVHLFSCLTNPVPATLQALNGGTDVVTDDNAGAFSILKFPLLPVLGAAIGLEIYPVLNATRDKPAGLGLGLYFDPSSGLTFPLTDDLSLGVQYTGATPLDVGIVILPDRPLQSVSNVFGGTGPQVDLSAFVPEFVYASSDQKTLLFDTSFGAKLEFASWALRGGAFAEASGFYVEFDLKGATLTISASQGDGFLQDVLPTQPMAQNFDLTVGFSSKTGLYFGGSANLTVKFATDVRIGPVTFEAIAIAVKTANGNVQLTLGADIASKLGPLDIIVENVGAAVAFSLSPDCDGNLGPLQASLGFNPPSGAAVSINAARLTGGGFLRLDPDKGEYTGVLDLQLEDTIAVKAIGLLVTKLPDGASGYSLLVIITAEGFRPIPLGLGFNLTGIGGLLAINRTFDEDVLRAGLRNHTLDSVMFPRDPIRNAPQILSNLNHVFPPAVGHHLFGPVAQITWGAPALITANLALVLEIGARLRLLILAQVAAVLPTPEQDLIRLQMDAVGIIDFDQGTAALDATLHDSRLLRKFPLTGDMALRLSWETNPSFALAVGGLHPAFRPPPGFPKLDRIALSLGSDNPRLRCEAYFAITANTVQFGAHAELSAAAAGFTLAGQASFDVLIQLAPFAFLAGFYAQLQLKRGSTNLFKVRVEGALAGPRPLNLKAKATFEILWWDVTVRVDATLVDGERPPLPTPIDVFVLLSDALNSASNWTSQLPTGQRQVVTFRAATAAATDTLLHPLGTLSIKQTVVPLDLDISCFGSTTPAGARRFSITSVVLGGQNQMAQPLRDFFAPAQFLEMSDDEKLTRPSFESMTGGVRVGSVQFIITPNDDDWLEVPAIEFETLIVDPNGDTRPSPPPGQTQTTRYRLTPILLGLQARFGAAGGSALRRTGKARYRSTADKYQVIRDGWTVASTDDLTVQAAPTSYSEAVEALTTIRQQQPGKAGALTIVRRSELSLA